MAQFGSVQELMRTNQCCILLAVCLASGDHVVIKQYIKSKMSTRADRKMRREVRLMYCMRGQEGVAQILGDFETAANFHIVVEHYSGGDLYKRAGIKQEGGAAQRLEEHWVCSKIIAPLLRTLCILHERHIVHRDIKQENIFLTRDDRLHLGDFGLAIQQQEELPFLRAGTLDYMAPEVLANPLSKRLDEGGPHSEEELRRLGFAPYDEKVDVWAVGVLAYELMCGGDPPFFDDEPEATQRLIMQCDLAAVPFPRDQLLSPWADFVRTALQRDPRQRPSAAQLLRHCWVQQHLAARPRAPLAPPRAAALARMASLPALPMFKPVGLSSLAPEEALAAATLVSCASATAELAVKPLPCTTSSSACHASVLSAPPSGDTSASASSCCLSTLAEPPAAAGLPPLPPCGSCDLSAAPSSASCLTLTGHPCRCCSACRLGAGCSSNSLACSGSLAAAGCGAEDSDMPLVSQELSAADPGSFTAAAQPQPMWSGTLDMPVPSNIGLQDALQHGFPMSPFAAQLNPADTDRAAPNVCPTQPPASAGQQGHPEPLTGSRGPSKSLFAARVSADVACADGPWASADGGGAGGDMRLDKAGHRNRVVAYMQKQRTSLLRTLKVGHRAHRRNPGAGGSSRSNGSDAGGSEGRGSL